MAKMTAAGVAMECELYKTAAFEDLEQAAADAPAVTALPD